MGDDSPTDSADKCYMEHDQCYDACGDFPDPECKAACDADLVRDLEQLPDDPRKWPIPPRSGTEIDSRVFRRGAIMLFRE